MKVVILAGGEGKRLRPYTLIIPKPLLPIGDTPMLTIVFEKLKKHGINEVFLAVNYKADVFETLYGDGSKIGIKIHYIREHKPLGTAGPLRAISNLISDNVFVTNGDIICDINVLDLEKFHKEMNADITVVTRKIKTKINFGVLNVEKDLIIDWKEKPEFDSEISAGMYMISPEVLKKIPENEFFDMNELAKKVITEGGKVARFLYSGNIEDVGNVEDYNKAQNNLKIN